MGLAILLDVELAFARCKVHGDDALRSINHAMRFGSEHTACQVSDARDGKVLVKLLNLAFLPVLRHLRQVVAQIQRRPCISVHRRNLGCWLRGI